MSQPSTKDLLIVSDLDGTLMRDSGEVSDYSKDVIRRLLAAGYHFSIASARSLVSIRRIFADVELPLPVVSYNGAVVSHLNSRDYESITSLDVDVFVEIMNVVNKMGFEPYVSTYAATAEHRYYRNVRNEGMQYVVDDLVEKNDRRMIQISDFSQAQTEPILEMNVIGTAQEADAFYTELNKTIGKRVSYVRFESRYSPGWHWVSMSSPVVSKAAGCEKIIKELGLEPQNLIVFGDEDNDVKMFEYAGTSIAVDNAIEPIKSLATELIGSNDEDSVAKYLEKKFLS